MGLMAFNRGFRGNGLALEAGIAVSSRDCNKPSSGPTLWFRALLMWTNPSHGDLHFT